MVVSPAFGVVVVPGGTAGPVEVVVSTDLVVTSPEAVVDVSTILVVVSPAFGVVSVSVVGVVVPGGTAGPTVVDSSAPVVVIPLFGVVVSTMLLVVNDGIVVVSTFGPVVGPTAHPLKSTCILIGVLSSDTTGYTRILDAMIGGNNLMDTSVLSSVLASKIFSTG